MDSLAIALLGFYTARRGIFHNLKEHIGFIGKVMWISLSFHVLSAVWLFAIRELTPFQCNGSGWIRTTYDVLSLHGNPYGMEKLLKLYSIQALALFYICLIIMLLQNGMLKMFSRPVAKVGRMALSNYLLHSLIGTTLFYGYGLGLYGKLGIAKGTILAMFVIFIQTVISCGWLRYFRFGPTEWMWRSLTYWKLQPIIAQKT